MIAGEWDDALAEIDAGLAVGDAVGTRLAVVGLQTLKAYVALQRGDLEVAIEAAAEAEAQVMRSGAQFGFDWLMRTKAQLLEEQDPAQALAVLNDAWDIHEAVGASTYCLTFAPDLIRLAMAAAAEDRARVVSEHVDEVASSLATATASGTALRCRGLLTGQTKLLLSAVEMLPLQPPTDGVCRGMRGRRPRFGADGSAAEASTLSAEAVAIYDRLGAVHPRQRAAAALRKLGVRCARRTRRRPDAGWESVTDGERRVADLVALGLTNREIGQRLFISPRTVETHLARVFAKLGLPSRATLAAEIVGGRTK